MARMPASSSARYEIAGHEPALYNFEARQLLRPRTMAWGAVICRDLLCNHTQRLSLPLRCIGKQWLTAATPDEVGPKYT